MLPNATLEQKMATGFNRNHRANTEDGIIPEYVVDRVGTTSAVFLGATLGCARCQNHKYDPFNAERVLPGLLVLQQCSRTGRAMKYGNSDPVIPAPTKAQQAALAAIDEKYRSAEEVLGKKKRTLRTRRSSGNSGSPHQSSGCLCGIWTPPFPSRKTTA